MYLQGYFAYPLVIDEMTFNSDSKVFITVAVREILTYGGTDTTHTHRKYCSTALADYSAIYGQTGLIGGRIKAV
jgi:hypothetical protein